MSSLIFHTDETQAFVATDTLATSPDGEPLMFTTKAFIVPHLKLLMAGTGSGGFLGKWFIQVNDRMIVRDVDHLNAHSPLALRALWQRHKEEFSIPEGITTTVYHFGFSETTDAIHSYAYRSANNFTAEMIRYGLGTKPGCPTPEPYSLPQDLTKMMEDQRALEAAKPKGERVYIGGEIQVHHLTEHGFQVYKLHRFGDYERDEVAIYDNFRK